MRVLVTGSSGMLGQDIFRSLSDSGKFQVSGVDIAASKSLCSSKMFKGDLTNIKFLKEVVRTTEPEIIIHCAAYVNLRFCEEHQADTKILHKEVTEWFCEYKPAGCKIIYISTDSVFDGRRGNYRESDKTAPLNFYAESKRMGECVVRRQAENLVLRTNIFGYSLPLKESIAEWAITSLEKGETIIGYTNIFFNAIYTRDLADLIPEMILGDLSGLYHTASQNNVSKYSFLKYLACAIGKGHDLVRPGVSTDMRLYPPRPANTTLNVDKLAALYKLPSVEEGIDRMINNFTRDNEK